MVELNAEAQKQLADMFVTMANNPKTRAQTVKLAREAGLTLNLPDVEAATMREEMDAKLAERDSRDEQRRVIERQQRQRAALISERGFTDDDVTKMEKEVMEKHGIGDYEVAAKIFAADTTPASAVPEMNSGVWEMPAFPKEMMTSPRNFARKEAYKVIDENRRKRA